MRVRLFVGAVVVVAAASMLAGCRTNVGVAARVNGETITETQLSSYLTQKAQPYAPAQSPGTNVAPKPFVLNIVIQVDFFKAVLAQTPAGAPSDARLSSLTSTILHGRSALSLIESSGLHGYTASFAQQIVVYSALNNLIGQESQKVDLNAIAAKLDFPVSVNPRYGTWNAKKYQLNTGRTDGRPAFLALQP